MKQEAIPLSFTRAWISESDVCITANANQHLEAVSYSNIKDLDDWGKNSKYV